ncbi:hypothetical protein NQ318_016612 [Aromia moschata]|uniref:THAP-type domain-containing protein n=1 Tax=Aromia moschata TaxID=1265417 RepID=A0AAV8XM28_9CUCU|nr:hypothetical protein NQ318_016612 [Aromia moschata]
MNRPVFRIRNRFNYCYACKSNSQSSPYLTFFKFPKEELSIEEAFNLLGNKLKFDAMPTIFDPVSDPLSVSPNDDLSVFGSSANNIEIVIEDESDDDGTPGTKSNPFVVQVTDILGSDGQSISKGSSLNVPSVSAMSDVNILDDNKCDEILKVEEPLIQEVCTSKCEVTVHQNKEDGSHKKHFCFVPECQVNYYTKETVYWFSPPTDKNLKSMWDICIGRKDRRLSLGDFICHKHFSEEDIMHEVTVPARDGDITFSHNKPKLRKGAVPCIKFHEECCVPTCKRTSGRMYCFPIAYNSDFRLWVYMIKNKELKNLKMKELVRHRVCEIHFASECFEGAFSLKRTAAPTLFLPDSYTLDTVPLLSAKMDTVTTSPLATICAYKECRTRANMGKRIFKFPANSIRCIQWLKACGREELITTQDETVLKTRSKPLGVCEDHFAFSCFSATLNDLEPDAVPTQSGPTTIVDLRESIATPSVETLPSTSLLKTETNPISVKIAPLNPSFIGRCFYNGCDNTLADGVRFFNFPAEKERYKAWMTACGYKNLSNEVMNIIIKGQKVCSKHFEKDMFLTESVLKRDAMPVDFKTNRTTSSVKPSSVQQTSITTNDGPKISPNNEPNEDSVCCAVKNCGNFYVSKRKVKFHKFPNPDLDPQRFDMWLKLVANDKLLGISKEEILMKYIVCYKHFEAHFFSNGNKMSQLNSDAVPTLNLTAGIQWFFESDYYKYRLQKYFQEPRNDNKESPSLNISDPVLDVPSEKEIIEWRKDENPSLQTGTNAPEDKTKCVLHEDRIDFPGMGRYLYMEKSKKLNKRKFPFGVYRQFKSGYGLNNDIDVGESIRIHTAIIIDDDDDCERAVLQQLLDKRKRKK